MEKLKTLELIKKMEEDIGKLLQEKRELVERMENRFIVRRLNYLVVWILFSFRRVFEKYCCKI